MSSNTIGQSQPGGFVPPVEAGPSISESDGNSSKEMFHAASQNPITEVPREEVAAVIDGFTQSLGNFKASSSGSPQSEETERNGANDAARSVAHDIKNSAAEAEEGGKYQVLKYDLGGGHTAAVMGLWHSGGETAVDSLAAHPGTSGGGSTMIEEAVNQSLNGELTVESRPLTEGFYESVGFRRNADQDDDDAVSMHLDPSQSDKWSQSGGRWQLKAQEDKKYTQLQDNGAVGSKRPRTGSPDEDKRSAKRKK